MPSRPALGRATAALCALLALTSCQGSPEAGHPNTTPASPTATPAPTAPSTPAWTPEEEAAISAARTRYLAARAATEQALQAPAKANRTALEGAGNGGTWLTDVIEEITFYRDRGWYQAGSVKLSPPSVKSVRLDAQQPEVTLTACVDTSAVVLRYQTSKKPVPVGPDNGERHLAQARMVLAPGSTGQKAWFLVEEGGGEKC
jgi:hypothetical protein